MVMMMAAYCISFDRKNCPLSNRVSTSAGPVEFRAPAPDFVLVARPPEICLGNWEAFFKCWLRSEAGQVGVEKLARHLQPNYSKHHLSVAQAIPCSLHLPRKWALQARHAAAMDTVRAGIPVLQLYPLTSRPTHLWPYISGVGCLKGFSVTSLLFSFCLS